MSKGAFNDRRWQHTSWKGVKFDNSKVTNEQKKKTKEFHEIFKNTFAKNLVSDTSKQKHSH